MIFSEQSPLSQYAIDSDFADDATARKLAWLGYKPNGEQSTLGKISSWLPAVGVGLNLAARGVANKNGAEDALANIQQDTDNRLMKTAIGAGVATGGLGVLGATGAIGGTVGTWASKNAFDLIKGGLGMSANFGGQLAFDQEYDLSEQDYIYR